MAFRLFSILTPLRAVLWSDIGIPLSLTRQLESFSRSPESRSQPLPSSKIPSLEVPTPPTPSLYQNTVKLMLEDIKADLETAKPSSFNCSEGGCTIGVGYSMDERTSVRDFNYDRRSLPALATTVSVCESLPTFRVVSSFQKLECAVPIPFTFLTIGALFACWGSPRSQPSPPLTPPPTPLSLTPPAPFCAW